MPSTAQNRRWAALTEKMAEIALFVGENGVGGVIGTALAYVEAGQADDYVQDVFDTAYARISAIEPEEPEEVEEGGEGSTSPKPVTRKLGNPTEYEVGGKTFKLGHTYQYHFSGRSGKNGSVWKVVGTGRRGTVAMVGLSDGSSSSRRGASIKDRRATVNDEQAGYFVEVTFSQCRGYLDGEGNQTDCTESGYPNYGQPVTFVAQADNNAGFNPPEQCSDCKSKDKQFGESREQAKKREANKANLNQAIRGRRAPKAVKPPKSTPSTERRAAADLARVTEVVEPEAEPKPRAGRGRTQAPSVGRASMESNQQPNAPKRLPMKLIGEQGIRRGGSDR